MDRKIKFPYFVRLMDMYIIVVDAHLDALFLDK